jgi:hypothetical protein
LISELLAGAAWVIGHLGSRPPAEDACACTPGRQGSCAELAMDLRLAAATLDEAATAGHDNAYIGSQVRGGPAENLLKQAEGVRLMRNSSLRPGHRHPQIWSTPTST